MSRCLLIAVGAVVVTTSALACSSNDARVTAPQTCAGTELIVAASDYTSSVLCGAPPCDRPATAV